MPLLLVSDQVPVLPNSIRDVPPNTIRDVPRSSIRDVPQNSIRDVHLSIPLSVDGRNGRLARFEIQIEGRRDLEL